MAEVNNDGSRATTAQRVGNFLGNGGGAITSRSVMLVMLPIIGTLLGLMWNDLKEGQNRTLAVLEQHTQALSDQNGRITGNAARIDAMAGGQQRIWVKLGNHDAIIADTRERLKGLEECQPNCHPR